MYIIQFILFFIIIIIHLEFKVDDKIRIFRVYVWFIILVGVIIMVVIIIIIMFLSIVYLIIVMYGIFCVEFIIVKVFQFIVSDILIIQKWKGRILIFIIIDKLIIVVLVELLVIIEFVVRIDEIMIDDDIDWIMKCFIEFSFFFLFNIVVIVIELISFIIHIVNQLFIEIDEIRVVKFIVFNVMM